MTFKQVVQAAIPGASEELADFIIWNRTPFPMGEVTARSLYRAASAWRRANEHGINLCDFCHRIAMKDHWTCEQCDRALGGPRS